LKNTELAKIIGVSAPTVTRLRNQGHLLSPTDKSFELAALLVRLYRGLSPILGGDDLAARSWLRSENIALNGRPIDLITSVSGLTDTLRYVDARRAAI
ncbi:MAG: antitoxin Xre/MbcA/ParS toxin-binding domain-containing protein, partial [Pseudomonadota bacterium]